MQYYILPQKNTMPSTVAHSVQLEIKMLNLSNIHALEVGAGRDNFK